MERKSSLLNALSDHTISPHVFCMQTRNFNLAPPSPPPFYWWWCRWSSCMQCVEAVVTPRLSWDNMKGYKYQPDGSTAQPWCRSFLYYINLVSIKDHKVSIIMLIMMSITAIRRHKVIFPFTPAESDPAYKVRPGQLWSQSVSGSSWDGGCWSCSSRSWWWGSARGPCRRSRRSTSTTRGREATAGPSSGGSSPTVWLTSATASRTTNTTAGWRRPGRPTSLPGTPSSAPPSPPPSPQTPGSCLNKDHDKICLSLYNY